jgi:hypothetical protein
MQNLNNEKGAALLIVFLIVSVFIILGFSISSYMVQSSKIRAFADDEIQGKMLADMGLTYFQKYIEKNVIHSGIASDDAVISKVNEIAAKNEGERILRYKQISLPNQEDGGFAIGYAFVDNNKEDDSKDYIPESDGTVEEPSQPFIRKLKVSVIGLPPRAASDVQMSPKVVKLEAIVYINTVPAAFHYAISTPSDLRLLGGSNIIGNVAAGNIVTSTEYQYSEDNVWRTSGDGANQPYIEGKVVLSAKNGGIYRLPPLSSLSKITDETYNEEFDEPYEKGKHRIPDATDSQNTKLPNDIKGLRTANVFTPKTLENDNAEAILSAPGGKPYFPGYEPPFVENVSSAPAPLFEESIEKYIKDQLEKLIPNYQSSSQQVGEAGQPIALETLNEDEGSFDILSDAKIAESPKFSILSQQKKGETSAPLTVRLTGNRLEGKINQLFITPETNNHSVTVEMGRKGSFASTPTKDGDPFTFTGSIYIKGNLDIVGDIDIRGAIYVDGDVVIREAGNVSEKKGEQNNLAIIASGKISLTNRYADETINKPTEEWKDIKPSPILSAFLYSEDAIEIYSRSSFNWIQGGIATKDSYIELNTRREPPTTPELGGASRMVIQFNRGIFENPTPGLPSADKFYADIYDMEYSALEKEEKDKLEIIQ